MGNYSGGTETTHYVGGMLEKLVTSTRTHYKHYIAGPGGLVATYTRRSDATEDTFYFTKDHLGSIDSVTNASGTVQVRTAFEAFGKRRNESGWSGAVPGADLTAIANTTRRGYTEHEMLDNLGLVHMNGRVQDPTIGRFLSADPNVPDPTSGQSFNRYSYVQNNPLTRIDPSGFTDRFPHQDEFGNSPGIDRTSLGSGSRCYGGCNGTYQNGTFSTEPTTTLTWTCENCDNNLMGLGNRTLTNEEAQRLFDRGGATPAAGYNRDGDFVQRLVPTSWEYDVGTGEYENKIPDMGRGTIIWEHYENTREPNFGALGRQMEQFQPGMDFALQLGILGTGLVGGAPIAAGKVVGGAAARLTGQMHHAISRTVYKALQQHPVLRSLYQARDARFVTQARDALSHRGYQQWHRDLDAEVAAWIRANPNATPTAFETYLRGVYQRPDLLERFPNGL